MPWHRDGHGRLFMAVAGTVVERPPGWAPEPPPEPPLLVSLAPAFGLAGSQLTLTGTNLLQATGVRFALPTGSANITTDQFVTWTDDTIAVAVPALSPAAGTVEVGDATGWLPPALAFTISAPIALPILSSWTASSGTVIGPGSGVTLYGSGLDTVSVVTFHGPAAEKGAAPHTLAPTQLAVNYPGSCGAGDGWIMVTNPAGNSNQLAAKYTTSSPGVEEATDGV
jgi:hypothetical protein